MDANSANRAASDHWPSEDSESSPRSEPAAGVLSEKRPLYRGLPPELAFPVDALGPLSSAAVAIHQQTQAPLAMCAQSVLAAATLASQAQRDVLLPGGGQRPLTGIFLSIAESGERKSSVDRLALAPAHAVELDWRRQAEAEALAYSNAKVARDTARDKARRKHSDAASIRAALDAIGAEPKPPAHPMLLIADPTPEALTLHLAGRATAGVFTAEGGLLIGGAAFNDEARMRMASLLNILWDGDPIRRARVTTGNAFLPGRRCTAHVMVQPVVAERLFGDPMFEGIGLMGRMLMVAPASTAGSRLFREPPTESAAALATYNDRMMHLLKRPAQVHPDAPDALSPPAMRLQSEARNEWIRFHDTCERDMARDGPLSSIRAFAAKLPEHAGRIAAVLSLSHDPEAMEVPLIAMQAAIALATHYANEMLRLNGGLSVTAELRTAERLLVWWQAQPSPIVHLAAIYQFGPPALRDARQARKAVSALVENGWAEQLPVGTVVDGKPRKEVWRLVS